jgi:hypothetical protein
MDSGQEEEPKIENFAGLAEIAAAMMRVLVLEKPESGLDRAEAYVRLRCKDCEMMLDFCASRINALEQFVTKLTKVKAITDTEEFGVLLDELMTHIEKESEEYRNDAEC